MTRHPSRVLITGAGGLIGGATAQLLHRSGHEVTGIYRTARDAPWTVEVRDLSRMGSLGALDAPDVIIHCAARLPPAPAGPDADAAAAINRRIDDEVLAFWRAGGGALIYASGTAVYGHSDAPCDERAVPVPRGPYAAGKRRTEELMEQAGGSSVSLRISSPYGPAQRTWPVLRRFIELAVTGADLPIHGSGTREQDFIAAADVARAVAACLERPAASGPINIASGAPISMQALAELVIASTPGTASQVRSSGRPDPQDGVRARFVVERARNELGWQAQTSLAEGIAEWVGVRRKAAP